MENEIQVFNSEQFGQIRTAGTAEEPMFCLADVCRALDLDASAVMRRLDNGVISSHPIPDNLGRIQQTNFVNEDGLYDVILDSRKPEAKKFRKWVTSEVLPSIRKTGGYLNGDATMKLLANPDFIILMAKRQKKLMEQLDVTKRVNAGLREKNELLANTVKQLKKGQSVDVSRAKTEAMLALQRDKLLVGGAEQEEAYMTSEIASELGYRTAVPLNKLLCALRVQTKVKHDLVLLPPYSEKNLQTLKLYKRKNVKNGQMYSCRVAWNKRGRQLILCLMDNGLDIDLALEQMEAMMGKEGGAL